MDLSGALVIEPYSAETGLVLLVTFAVLVGAIVGAAWQVGRWLDA